MRSITSGCWALMAIGRCWMCNWCWEEQRVAIRLEPVKKVARMLKRHLDRILSWFRHHISNGMAKGYNSRIQSIKTAARGFRNFANYRIRILFFCGKLNLLPNSTYKYVR